MGKVPVKIRSVTYALSPYQQKAMTGLWTELGEKLIHKVKHNYIDIAVLVFPIVGTYTYAQNYREREKLEHRD